MKESARLVHHKRKDCCLNDDDNHSWGELNGGSTA